MPSHSQMSLAQQAPGLTTLKPRCPIMGMQVGCITNLEEAYDCHFSSSDEFHGGWDVCEPYGFLGSAETICSERRGSVGNMHLNPEASGKFLVWNESTHVSPTKGELPLAEKTTGFIEPEEPSGKNKLLNRRPRRRQPELAHFLTFRTQGGRSQGFKSHLQGTL